MSTQNNSTDKSTPDCIPHSTIVESMAKEGQKLNDHVQLSSRDEKAKYLVDMTDLFHKEWKKTKKP
tara:strand:+ start:3570 stop:3767 length:198 start_codon:yes stop_codon:yes gene_type:complete